MARRAVLLSGSDRLEARRYAPRQRQRIAAFGRGKLVWSLDFDLQMTGYGMASRSLGYDAAALKILVTTVRSSRPTSTASSTPTIAW